MLEKMMANDPSKTSTTSPPSGAPPSTARATAPSYTVRISAAAMASLQKLALRDATDLKSAFEKALAQALKSDDGQPTSERLNNTGTPEDSESPLNDEPQREAALTTHPLRKWARDESDARAKFGAPRKASGKMGPDQRAAAARARGAR